MEYAYSISGIPGALGRLGHTHRKMWDTNKQLQLNYQMSLLSQHEGRSFFRNPIRMDITFYMPLPLKKPSSFLGKHYSLKPDLTDLMRFIEESGIGILYDSCAIISSATVKKMYDKDPRTILIITEL